MSGTSSTGRSVRRRTRLRTRVLAAGVAVLTAAPLALTSWSAASAQPAPVGQGFNLNASDLRFMFKQIRIAERHAATRTASDPCGTMRGPATDQIPVGEVGDTLPWGLRLIDGTCNNLVAGGVTVGSADQEFPRLVPKRLTTAENGTTYASNGTTVRDSQPRVISNLVVDQTAGNPAAVEAAGEVPVTTPSGAFFIPNVAPDVGLSAPYNSWFTLFGQFFDHGLDLVNKGGNGSVFMPLKQDDPLYVPGAPTNFMVLTRATHDGDHEANNQTSPWVDQSQTYTSHASHQVFLREYAMDAAGQPQTTGELLTGPGGGMGTWADVKEQARTTLGIALTDADALRIPLLATDPYGRFERGPNGLPQLVVPGAPGGLVEGDLTSPVSTAGATATGHAFLDDIAHNAVPKSGSAPDDDTVVTPGLVVCEAPDFPAGCVNEYDDEMLAAHFVAGDGRVNENIGLTSVHHVFHSEHNRLVGDIDSKITSLLSANEQTAWRATGSGGWDYGERLFQAARFVTEMEYQHLAFEEFIRKVQPLVNPFGEGGTGYNTAIDPAIKAEFAHAVYRFGHSMLTESVDRVRANGTRDDIDLLAAFLNPPAFLAGGRTPEQAAGDVVRGMTRQIGNELDEFVTEALRNRLLGLPLDLAALNIARARDTGVPTLNAARRSFFAASNNSSLAPYESWADFSFSIKHQASLNNFIAAYGTHPTIEAATTTVTKRAAADALVYGPNGKDGEVGTPDDIAGAPEDRYAFLNSAPHEVTDPVTGETTVANTTWVNAAGRTTTGVDRIDLWAGGLAEKQHVFGGLLGPTFNYVFEAQMEDLQFGDRFYYLARTAGLNMLTQLEGNSFSELIQRNTDVSGLPADSFSTPGLTFDVAALGTSGAVLDDPATSWNESTLLTRMPNGTIRYGGGEHVVFNGTDGNNRTWSSEGDDTVRGNDGDDWMQGGDGNDNLIGGLGDDTLLDSNGDDTLKGGDGNDTLSSGQGFGGDLLQGGLGNDLLLHGNDLAESFAGPGDDFVLGGAGDDTVFGDDGDDWIESGATISGTGGGAFNLLQGDNGAPFQDDPNEPGHDVLIGYGGETDNDAEGGDDVMLNGPGIQRNEGMLGFDYATHDGDRVPADSDMALTGLLPPSVETNKDRFDMVESLSGWNLDDTLRGDDRDAAAMVDHELTAAGSARVAGLRDLIGGTTFTGGNLLLGGGGTDLIEGRGGDDLIDGDAQLNVRISVRSATDPAVEIDSVEKLADVSARVVAGTINPGQLRIVREIQTPANGSALDTAIFSGPRAEYDVAFGATTTVTHARGTAADGVDVLRNIERLRFSDVEIANESVVVTQAGPPTAVTATAGNATATVAWTAPADTGGAPVTQYEIQVLSGGTLVRTDQVPATPTNAALTGLTNGTAYEFRVRAVTSFGPGVLSAPSDAVTPATLPAAPTAVTATAGNASAALTWSAPANTGGAPITGYVVQVRRGTTVVRTDNLTGAGTSDTIAGLVNGTAYNFRVRAVTAVGQGPLSARSNNVTPVAATPPGAPGIGTAVAGNAQATVSWTAPTVVGSSPVTQYHIQVRSGGIVQRTVTGIAATARSAPVTGLTNGTAYDFRVRAVSAAGAGALSAASNTVTPGAASAVPGRPVIGTAVSGVAGGAITATANWEAPATDGGSAITGYRVYALRFDAAGAVVGTTVSSVQPATGRTLAMTLPAAGDYRFQVAAINAVGQSQRSTRSNRVAGV